LNKLLERLYEENFVLKLNVRTLADFLA